MGRTWTCEDCGKQFQNGPDTWDLVERFQALFDRHDLATPDCDPGSLITTN